MKLELESLLNEYSQDIDLSDENKRSKLEIIKKITKNKDWDNFDIEGNKEYGLTQILLYEYSTSIEKLTNGKVSYKQVTEKLSNLMGKLRYGKWKEQDSGIKYLLRILCIGKMKEKNLVLKQLIILTQIIN